MREQLDAIGLGNGEIRLVFSVANSLFKIAKQKCRLKQAPISLCGKSKKWTDCFTIDKDMKDNVHLVFYYNIGPYTHAEYRIIALQKRRTIMYFPSFGEVLRQDCFYFGLFCKKPSLCHPFRDMWE